MGNKCILLRNYVIIIKVKFQLELEIETEHDARRNKFRIGIEILTC